MPGGDSAEGRNAVFAIVKCKGFQYKVAPEETIAIPRTDLEIGSTLILDQVLLVQDGDTTKIGTPVVPGAKVEAEVLGHPRGPKIIVGKFKKRKGFRRRKGHRQDYTQIRIRSIQA
jgi:large subunit ribosomal protein L21